MVDGLLLYASKHGQHVSSVSIEGGDNLLTLRQLPPQLQPHSLQLIFAFLQLQPEEGYWGVLGPASGALKQLRLSNCTLLDGDHALLGSTDADAPTGAPRLGNHPPW